MVEQGHQFHRACDELPMHGRVRVESGETGGGENGFLVLEVLDDPGKQNIDAGRDIRNRLVSEHRREQRVGVHKQLPMLPIDHFIAASVSRAPDQLDES